MRQKQLIKRLKMAMVAGIILILIGHYILSYSGLPESMGITGMIIGASCIAFGLILSLPTKMYLTFIFVTRERNEQQQSDQSERL